MAVLAAVMLCAVALVALIVSVAGGGSDDDAGRSGELVAGARLELASLDIPAGSDRPIFRHSVVPGGVYTPDELKNVLVQDAVAATHYQGLNVNAVRAETVKQDRFAYVSYRKDDQIYWTRNKVRLSEGETILSDGTNEIRARCGNCISETPKLPVAEVEPASVEFDQLVDDPGDRFLSAAVRAALESSTFGPGGGSGTSGAAAGGSAGGASATNATNRGSSAPGAGGISGGGGGIGSTSGGSGDPSSGGQAGWAALGAIGGQPGDFPSSPVGMSASNVDSSSANPRPVDDSRAGAPGTSSGTTPSSPSGGTPSSPTGNAPHGPLVVASAPGSPSAPGKPGPADPILVASLPESQFVPPGTGTSIPPGIDPPPGFNPAGGAQPSVANLTPSTPGAQNGSGSEAAAVSLPEPGMLLLLGGGAAAAILRRFRRRN